MTSGNLHDNLDQLGAGYSAEAPKDEPTHEPTHETGRATPERPLIKTPVKASQPDLPQIRRKAQI